MGRYRTREGLRLKGKTAEEVLADLRSRAFLPGSDLDAYIRKTAKAATLQTGDYFRSGSAEELLNDLLGAGLIVKES